MVRVSKATIAASEKEEIRRSLAPVTLSTRRQKDLFKEIRKIRGHLRADRALGLSSHPRPKAETLKELAAVEDWAEGIIETAKRLGGLNPETRGEMHPETLCRLEIDGGWSDENREQLLALGIALHAAAKVAARIREAERHGGWEPRVAEWNAVKRLSEIFESVTDRRSGRYAGPIQSPMNEGKPVGPFFESFVCAALGSERDPSISISRLIYNANQWHPFVERKSAGIADGGLEPLPWSEVNAMPHADAVAYMERYIRHLEGLRQRGSAL
jgi:hypothetical protein